MPLGRPLCHLDAALLAWPAPARAHCDTLNGPVVNAARLALADRFFFETIVRIHRVAEGAPYTGLKPAGSVEPAIALADRALDTGSADALIEELTAVVAEGLRARLTRAAAAARLADTSVDAGRAFVAAYVEFIHYAEGVHVAATAGGHHGEAAHPVTAPPGGAR